MWPYPGEADLPSATKAGAGFIVGATTHPRFLDPLQERFQAWQQAIERATVVRLAADGL